MKALYTTLGLAIAALVAAPAGAQDERAVDTLVVEHSGQTIVILGEDGERIRILAEKDKEGGYSAWIEEGDDKGIIRRRLRTLTHPRGSVGAIEVENIELMAEDLAASLRGKSRILALGAARHNSELANQEAAARSLAMKAKLADGDEKEALTAELREALEEIFALKQELRQEEMEKLREKLAESEQELAERAEVREEIIERRLSELLGSRSKYDW